MDQNARGALPEGYSSVFVWGAMSDSGVSVPSHGENMPKVAFGGGPFLRLLFSGWKVPGPSDQLPKIDQSNLGSQREPEGKRVKDRVTPKWLPDREIERTEQNIGPK